MNSLLQALYHIPALRKAWPRPNPAPPANWRVAKCCAQLRVRLARREIVENLLPYETSNLVMLAERGGWGGAMRQGEMMWEPGSVRRREKRVSRGADTEGAYTGEVCVGRRCTRCRRSWKPRSGAGWTGPTRPWCGVRNPATLTRRSPWPCRSCSAAAEISPFRPTRAACSCDCTPIRWGFALFNLPHDFRRPR
jgi:hypothetical protein